MIHRTAYRILLALVTFSAFSVCVAAQEHDNKSVDPPPNVVALRLLEQTLEVRGFSEPMKLRKAAEILSDKFGGKLKILANVHESRNGARGSDFDPYDVDVVLPDHLNKLNLKTTLQLFADQVYHGKGTFLIREGSIELVSADHETFRRLLKRPIHASLERRPFFQVVQDLADYSGLTINLDPNTNKKGDLAISAAFRGNSLEDALTTITEMVELKYVVLHNSIYITTATKAEAIEKEQRKRQDQPPMKKSSKAGRP